MVKKYINASVPSETGRITPHKLRSTYAEIMLKATGGDLEKVQKLMGHSPITSTTHYVSSTEEEKAAAIQMFFADCTAGEISDRLDQPILAVARFLSSAVQPPRERPTDVLCCEYDDCIGCPDVSYCPYFHQKLKAEEAEELGNWYKKCMAFLDPDAI